MQDFEFTCSCCGEKHSGAPSFSYPAPYQYQCLSDNDKELLAKLSDDLCRIEHDDRIDHFIRVVVEIPIEGCTEPFTWGVWVSVSQPNFDQYVENFSSETYTGEYFGWFCNDLPHYESTLSLKSHAIVTSDGQRPKLELEPTEHELSTDFQSGISWEKAVKIAEEAMHASNA